LLVSPFGKHVGIGLMFAKKLKYQIWSQYKTRGVSHCGLAIYIKKYLKAKEELWKLKYFTMQKYI
jgi:hypothetical protein